MKKGVFICYKQTSRIGGKWFGDCWIVDYDDIREAKTYKQITLRTVKGSEIVVPQIIDPKAPVICPLVDNIVRSSFETQITLSQQDADNRKLVIYYSVNISNGERGGSPAPSVMSDAV